MYLKINGEDTHYDVTIMPFTSQHGKKAIKFMGESVPSTNKGFTYYNDDDSVLADLSDFVYEYAPNEYTAEEDIVEYPKGSDAPLPTSAIARLNSKVNKLSSQVTSITPYTETKTAYIDDKEIDFDYRAGTISVCMISRDGEAIPHEVVVDKDVNKIKVLFEALKNVADVTISIS